MNETTRFHQSDDLHCPALVGMKRFALEGLLRRAGTNVVVTGLIAVALSGCGGTAKNAGSGGRVVATVGAQTVTKNQLDALLSQAQASYTAQKRRFPKAGSTAFRLVQDQALQYLIQQAEYAQLAAGMGISITDAQVEARIDNIVDQYFGGDEKKYEAQLKTQGMTRVDAENQQRAQLLSAALDARVDAKVKVSRSEIAAYYARHRSSYRRPRSRSVRYVVVGTKALAAAIERKLAAGADFAALAKKYSTDKGSASVGGDAVVAQGTLGDQVDSVVFALRSRKISAPVFGDAGWYVVQALAPARPAAATPLQQVSALIRQQLLETKQNAAIAEFRQSAMRRFCSGKITYEPAFAPAHDPCLAPSASAGAESQP